MVWRYRRFRVVKIRWPPLPRSTLGSTHCAGKICKRFQLQSNKSRHFTLREKDQRIFKFFRFKRTALSEKKLPEQQQERSDKAENDVENAAASADDTADVGVTEKRTAASSGAVGNATKKHRANEDESMTDAKKEAARKETKKKAAKKKYDAGR